MMFSNVGASLPRVRAGRLRVLAQSGLRRSAVVPDAPTIDEAGVPGFEVIGFFGVMAPAGTPPEIVARLNAEITRALGRSEVRERFAAQALEPGRLTAEEYAAFIGEQAVTFGRPIRAAGITAK